MIDDLSPEIVSLLDERTQRLVSFILELDRMKQVLRRSPLLDNSRVETDAEHSWHVAMMILLLSRDAPAEVDRDAALQMMLIHDIVEIDAGDTFLYDTSAEATQHAREQRAANRLFGLLPDDIGSELRQIWEEFEAGETATARFARGIDRLQPLFLNYFSGGGTWNMPGVHREDVLRRKAAIRGLGGPWWEFAQALIADGARRGRLRNTPAFKNWGPESLPTAFPTFDLSSKTPAEETPQALATARSFEDQYGCAFSRLVRLPGGLLDALHAPILGSENAFESQHFASTVASTIDPSVLAMVERMSDLAENNDLTIADPKHIWKQS